MPLTQDQIQDKFMTAQMSGSMFVLSKFLHECDCKLTDIDEPLRGRIKQFFKADLETRALSGVIQEKTALALLEKYCSEQTEVLTDENTNVTKAFNATRVYLRNAFSTKAVRLNRGGTRSSKTYSTTQIAVDWLLTGKIGLKDYPTGVFSVVRATLPALKKSVLRDIENEMKERGLYKTVIKHNKTEGTFTIEGVNRTLEYFSVDDEQKVRGTKRLILWLNEANEISFEKYTQLTLRGVEVEFIDFNPSDVDTWIKEEIEEKRASIKDDVEVIVSTYKDNQFLTPNDVAKIEYLKEVSPELWLVFGCGEYVALNGIIYPKWDQYKEAPKHDVSILYGIDFGWTHASTVTKVIIDYKRRNLYWEEVAYSEKLGLEEMAQIINQDEDYNNDRIVVCDSAEPRSIATLQNLGIQAMACAKKGFVSDIRRINMFNLYIHENSLNLQKEIKTYVRIKKKGEYTDEPVKFNDHALDGARYATIADLNMNGFEFVKE